MLKIIQKIIDLLLHLPAFALIYYFWQPISGWFLAKVPALGVDLYLSATYATYHLRNFSLLFNSFKDIWYGGYPFARDYPQLVFYLMMPFVANEGPVDGVRKFTVFALLFLILSCYLLFYKLSKNHGIAVLLAVLVILSPNIYGAATWAGSIPYFFSQAFFPLGLFAGAIYLDKPSLRRLAAVVLVTALGFMSNPLSMLAFLIPSLQVIIIFGGLHSKFPLKVIFGHIIFYNIGWLLAAFTVTFDTLKVNILNFSIPGVGANAGSGGSATAAGGSADIAQFYRNQIDLLFTRTNSWIFKAIIPGVLLIIPAFIFSKTKRSIFLIAPFILIAAWAFVHPYINLGGIFNLFRHDPYRAFWQFPIAVGALAAALWGYDYVQLTQWIRKNVYGRAAVFLVGLIISVFLVGFTFTLFNANLKKTLELNDTNVELSSAFPEALSIKTKKTELLELKKALVPSFMNPDDRNIRLYSADATVSIWWNVFFQMPMVRGYIDPPIGTQSRGGFFWLDIAIANDSLTRDFKVDEKTALNNALFLIDWYSLGYFEGGRLSSKGPAPGPSKYLVDGNIFEKDAMVESRGAILKYQTASGKPELVPDLPQYLHFYKVDEKFTSPILYSTNASLVLVVSTDPGYEDIMRILASENLNSKKIVPARSVYIDDLNSEKLEAFDAVFLHIYSYRNPKKAFELLENYVKGGGKVFIDTGSEVKESVGANLPNIFPFEKSKRIGFGSQWQLEQGDSKYLENVDSSKFGPLIYNDDEWKIAVPDSDLKDGSHVILSHAGKPVMIERGLGKGKVVWVGFNLAYHFNQYKSADEARIFTNIVRDFVNVAETQPILSQTKWEKPEKVTIETTEPARGILFKEQAYRGWKATADGKNLQIYKTGPTFPGFMYVSLAGVDGPAKVEFSYSGEMIYQFVTLINGLVVLLLLDLLITGGIVGKMVFKVTRKSFGKRITGWWQKEDG